MTQPASDKPSVPSRTVDSLAQQIRMAVVPRVLLDHVHVHPAQTHLHVAMRMEERLVELPACDRLARAFNLPQVDREVLLRIGCIDVVELPVGISLAGVQEAAAAADLA
jgi:hypothetical protein